MPYESYAEYVKRKARERQQAQLFQQFGPDIAAASETPSTLTNILDILGRPAAAVAGGVRAGQEGRSVWQGVTENLSGTRHDRFSDVLSNAGMPEGWARSALGFGLDIVGDPLTYVPVGLIGRGLKTAATPLLKAARTIPIVEDAAQAFGKAFVPYYRMPSELRDAVRVHEAKRRAIPSIVGQELYTLGKGTTPAEREAVALGLETYGPLQNPKVQALRDTLRDKYKQIFGEEASAGFVNPASEKALYAPYVWQDAKAVTTRKPVSLKNVYSEQRTTPTLADAIRAGADPDALTAALTRLSTGRARIADLEFTKDVLQKTGVAAAPGVMSVPGYAKLTVPAESRVAHLPVALQSGVTEKLKDVWVPEDIAKYMTRYTGTTGEAQDVMRGLDKLLGQWRGLATIYQPGVAFEATNLMGNLWNSLVTGQISPTRLLGETARRFMPESILPKYTRAVTGMTPEEVRAAGQSLGFDTMVAAELDDPTKLRQMLSTMGPTGINRLVQNILPTSLKDVLTLKPLRGMASEYGAFKRQLNATIENTSKQIMFENALEQYKHLPMPERLTEAYKAATTPLFNYAELTDFERNVLRRIFPFYTFTRKNLPFQMAGVLNNPKWFAAVSKLQDTLEGRAKERGEYEPVGLRPEYMQKQNVIQLPSDLVTGMGVAPESAVYVNPYLPFQDLSKLPLVSPSDSAKDIMSMLNPLAKTAIELSTGKSLFTDMPLWDPQLGMVKDVKPVHPYVPYIPGATTALSLLPFTETRMAPEYVGGKPVGEPTLQTSAWLQALLGNLVPTAGSMARAAQAITGDVPEARALDWVRLMTGARLPVRTADMQQAAQERALKTLKSIMTKSQQQYATPGEFFAELSPEEQALYNAIATKRPVKRR